MRAIILALLMGTVCLAADLPELTDTQKLAVRDAQVIVEKAVNAELRLPAQFEAIEAEFAAKTQAAQMVLNALVKSLQPADCKDCVLEESLTWKRPAPPEPKEEEQP